MKTKIILHGGNAHHQTPENDRFFKEILKDAPKVAKILLVYFAKEIDRIPTNKAEDVPHFENNKGDRALEFEVATEENFLGQIKRSDVIYLHGGKTLKLLEVLKKFPDFKNYLAGKIVAGESAGANVLASNFYSISGDGTFEGLNIIPLNFMPHFSGEDKLKSLSDNLEKLFLKDYEFKAFEIDL